MDEKQKQEIREMIQQELYILFKSGKIVFDQNIKMSEGRNIETGTGTGSKIGGLDTAKLSVYSATPIVRTSAIASPAADVDQLKTCADLIRTALTNFGITL